MMGNPNTAPPPEETVWVPAVPLPLLGWRTDRCMCGVRFRGKNRRAAYELHYRREHESPESSVQMAVSRSEEAALTEPCTDPPADTCADPVCPAHGDILNVMTEEQALEEGL